MVEYQRWRVLLIGPQFIKSRYIIDIFYKLLKTSANVVFSFSLVLECLLCKTMETIIENTEKPYRIKTTQNGGYGAVNHADKIGKAMIL